MTTPTPSTPEAGPAPGSPEAIIAALMQIAETLAPMQEGIDGYRANLIARGYSPTAAEVMTIEYHRHMLAAAFGGQKTGAT